MDLAQRPAELFFSYAHRDEDLRNELAKHLTLLRRQGVLSEWHDRQITAGSEWVGAIDHHTNSADVVLLLISADFIASDYCYDIEMRRALERHASGEARVIPVILRAVEWTGAPFGHLQALPTDARPVTSWSNRDEAFADVARGVRKAVTEIRAARPAPRNDFYFAAQQQILDDHAGRFVGRADADQALDQFIAANRCGYFLVCGGPGQGKTALAAHWVKRHRAVHHLVSRGGGRSDVRLILCSLLAQLAAGTRTPVAYSAALAELAKTFEELLADRARAATAPFVIVIDALDELSNAAGDEVGFLPSESVPEGVYVVVTSRPGARIEALEGRLNRIPHVLYLLPPLEPADVRGMLGERAAAITDADVERLVRAANGNPLYVETALAGMRSSATFDASQLPAALDGYYRRATRQLAEQPVFRDVLGALAVMRTPVSARDLAHITNHTERETRGLGLDPIREFLRGTDAGLTFYHEYFHDFVTRELLYADELRSAHARIAGWLQRPERAGDPYRWHSLAFHLFQSGDRERLLGSIDSTFLAGKVRRHGYAVLDDVELLTRALLDAQDAGLVERCVGIVDDLRRIVGSDIIEDAAEAVQFGASAGRQRRHGVVAPSVDTVPGVDVYAGLLPKGAVTADFVEVVPHDGRLLIAIGDAPSSGIKSAFVARFLANLFRSLVARSPHAVPADLLTEISRRISGRDYFEWVSMQCAAIDLASGRLALANAGHPFPVVYSAARRRWDKLPVRGELLQGGDLQPDEPHIYEQRHVEIAAGDVIVLLSDGLTEASARFHNPFGYRFADLVVEHAGDGARAIGESILAAWQAHPRARDWADDVTVVVAVIGRPSGNT